MDELTDLAQTNAQTAQSEPNSYDISFFRRWFNDFFHMQMKGEKDPLSSYALVFSAVSIAIIAGLSHFHPASRTLPQRVWTMTWLIFGIVLPPPPIQDTFRMSYVQWLKIGLLIFYAAPAIGGFVVVGQMLQQYGVCTQIG